MEKETAMKILKELHGKSLFAERTALETLIPELKESEDEKVRKRLICGMNALKEQKNETFATIPIDDAIAWLEKQGEQKPTVVDFNAKDWYVSKVDGKLHNIYQSVDKIEQKPTSDTRYEVKAGDNLSVNGKPFDYEHATITQKDFAPKQEPKFKVKYAGNEYNVFETKESAGITFYGIEDEPNHIDYVNAEDCEIISGYATKENGSPYPTKSAVFSEKKPDWSEEDENYLQSAENACEYQYGKNTSTILWLQSIKDRIGG